MRWCGGLVRGEGVSARAAGNPVPVWRLVDTPGEAQIQFDTVRTGLLTSNDAGDRASGTDRIMEGASREAALSFLSSLPVWALADGVGGCRGHPWAGAGDTGSAES